MLEASGASLGLSQLHPPPPREAQGGAAPRMTTADTMTTTAANITITDPYHSFSMAGDLPAMGSASLVPASGHVRQEASVAGKVWQDTASGAGEGGFRALPSSVRPLWVGSRGGLAVGRAEGGPAGHCGEREMAEGVGRWDGQEQLSNQTLMSLADTAAASFASGEGCKESTENPRVSR